MESFCWRVHYWREFLAVVIAHGLAAASPGPDFATVLRQSVTHGRRAALFASLGIGSGILFHLTYCLLGLGYVLRQAPAALVAVKYAGAAYLAYLGIMSLRAPARAGDVDLAAREAAITDGAAWWNGFFVNVLNPKLALFLISLFALVIDANTPKLVQAGYCLWMFVATIGWFSLVAVVFTREDVRRNFLRASHWIDRALGVVFLAFAVSLALTPLR